MENYIVEKTFGNKSKLIHIESYTDIVRNLNEASPTKRYFKIPDLSQLTEVTFEVNTKEINPPTVKIK